MILYPQILALHTAYCRESGRTVSLTELEYGKIRQWSDWMARQWTVADLVAVIRYVRAKIKAGDRREESLRLHNLIDPTRFEDDLQDASHSLRDAHRRRFERSDKASVLRTSGRATVATGGAMSAGDVLAKLKQLKGTL